LPEVRLPSLLRKKIRITEASQNVASGMGMATKEVVFSRYGVQINPGLRLEEIRVVKQKVGPISVRFKFTSFLTEINPPTHLKVIGAGEDMGKAGTFSQETTVDLREVSGEEVEISYRSDRKSVV
jgi:hypothetical protein